MSAEFNFAVDPESAHIVLESFDCPIIITPWELCKNKRNTFDKYVPN